GERAGGEARDRDADHDGNVSRAVREGIAARRDSAPDVALVKSGSSALVHPCLFAVPGALPSRQGAGLSPLQFLGLPCFAYVAASRSVKVRSFVRPAE